MEAIPLSGIGRHGKIFKPLDTNFEKNVLYYPSKSVGKDELDDVVAFELVDQTPGKVYDSIESNSFLFSDSLGDFIDEDEYAIISDCEENDVCAMDENLLNGDAFVTIALENGALTNGLNGYKPADEAKQKVVACKNHLSQASTVVNGDCKQPTANGSIVKNEFFQITRKPEIVNIKSITVNGATSRSTGDGNENEKDDLLYSYENTSTPNTDYEMKILAGRHDVSAELSLSTSDMELEEESEQRKNIFKFRSLSTQMKRPSEDISLQASPVESMITIPLEELRSVNFKQESSSKLTSYPKKNSPFGSPLSASDLKTNGPIPVLPVSRSLERSLPNSLFGNKEKRTGRFERRSNSNIIFGFKNFKNMKRSLSETTPPKESDLDITYIDKTPASTLPRGERKRGRYFPKKKTKDDVFFEIDNRYDEFESNFDYKPIELEMKTIVSSGVSQEDILSTSTEFISPRTSIDVMKRCEVTSRYISFFKQQEHNCKYISLAFFNVNQPKQLDVLDVPYEEIVEQVYTHVIEEVIIYEDEFCTCHDFECSICDDEWFIIK